jgi:hypothetical protein
VLATQLGRWRTVAAADEARALLDQRVGGSNEVLPAAALQRRLRQLCFLQHEYVRDEELLRPIIVPLHDSDGGRCSHDDDDEVWIATQASLDYLPQLTQLLALWCGPASIALVLNARSELRAARRGAEALSRATTSALRVRAVVANWRAPAENMPGGLLYPVNLARKVAFEALVGRPAWVWLLDAGHLSPCVGARARLQAQLRRMDAERRADTIVVTPALEAEAAVVFEQASRAKSMVAVRDMVIAGGLGLFHADYFSVGHRATNLDQWLQAHQRQHPGDVEPYAISY